MDLEKTITREIGNVGEATYKRSRELELLLTKNWVWKKMAKRGIGIKIGNLVVMAKKGF